VEILCRALRSAGHYPLAGFQANGGVGSWVSMFPFVMVAVFSIDDRAGDHAAGGE